MIKLVLAILLLTTTFPAAAKESNVMSNNLSELSTDQKAAEIVVRKYMNFLHSADTDGIISLYDEDAVFLPADAPTVIGKAKIREIYDANFKVMNIPEGDSTLEEATIHGDFAVVRLATRSTILILASNQKIVNDARELFILKRVGGQFKISRYMFNKP